MALIENPSNKVLDDQIRTAIAVVAQQLSTKARLGAVAQSFDPNAVDGDGDGKVQDGSPFERPAVISAVANASQRLGRILSKAASLSKSGRAREYNRRYSGMSASDIAKEVVPDSFEGWVALAYERMRLENPEYPPLTADTPPNQVKDMVRAIEDFVESDLVWMLSPEKAQEFKKLKKTDRAAAFKMLTEGAFDFSPEAVAKNRELVEHVLTTNPQFRAIVDRFGMPVITRFGENMDTSHLAKGFYADTIGMSLGKIRAPRSKGRMDGLTRGLAKWFMTATIENDVGSKKTKRWLSSEAPEALLVHEYGHYLANIMKMELTDMQVSERTKRWQAFRFAAGAGWKDTFKELGHPEWYEAYKVQTKQGKRIVVQRLKDIPDEIPHVLTAYGESSPSEAFAESFAALFALDGRDAHLVSGGMKELINDALELPSGKDPRESLTPKRLARQVVPDGLASRGSVMAINSERDSRFGEIDDPYELTAEVLGDLGKDDPVGMMVRKLHDLRDDPERWGRVSDEMKDNINRYLNIRRANEEEAAILAEVLINDPAFADMIRRHGISNFYFSETDLTFKGGMDVRGSLFAGFTPDESDNGRYWPPRVVIDMVGTSSLDADELRDVPSSPVSDAEIRKTRKAMNVPGGVTRTHVSKAHHHVIRHEGGHSIHDQLWERVHRGEIKGRRARLIRAYGKSTWEEFYAELGRPDLFADYQRATFAANVFGYPGDPKPGDEIAFIDSAYAWTTPREFFAETFAAYTSSNPDYRALMNDTALEHMQAMLGDSDVPDAGETRDLPETKPVPEAAAWEGFASTGGPPPRSYADVREQRVKEGKGAYSRSEMFRNTTTEQKVDLSVPENERDHMLMAWDQVFERMGLTHEEVSMIDLSDPANPKVPHRLRGALDGLEETAARIAADKMDFSPEMVRGNREALAAALDAFPRMREAAERFGMPPLTTMSPAYQEDNAKRYLISNLMGRFNEVMQSKDTDLKDIVINFMTQGIDMERIDTEPMFEKVRLHFQKMSDSGAMEKLKDQLVGGYSHATQTIYVKPEKVKSFISGTRYDPKFIPERGGWTVGGMSYEDVLLHEFAHHIDARARKRDLRAARLGDAEARQRLRDRGKFESDGLEKHLFTRYGQTDEDEFFAEAIAAVLSGNKDAEDMLSPEARKIARSIAGLPENDPVFAGRTRIPETGMMTLVDRFGSRWNKTPEGEWVNASGGQRSRDGVPDVLETFSEARQRTGLDPFDDVKFEHDGRTFTMRDNGGVFEVDVNGRTVATASVVEGQDGIPEIRSVDVLPGYEGVAPDKDLHEMVVDHARKKYPSARAPKRAKKTEVPTEGFASVGPEHHDAREIDGTPGTPEYVENLVTELEAAKASGKKVFFDYNGVTREVEITEITKGKNGHWYMKGRDAIRNNEDREFRLDRVSMPKRVKNPETGADEVAKKPGKPPRKPVPVFTGKAAEIFEGAQSWEEVAERLSKGRYVFFDFETTGIEEDEFGNMLHPGTPVQIGLVEIIDGKVTRRWSTHVNPGRPMSIDPKTGRSWSADNLKYKDPVTGEIKNLTDEWLSGQRPLKEALEEMLEFIGPTEDTILGGQNHPYDDDVMKRALVFAGLDESRWNPAGFIDSQALAQSLLDKDSDDYPRDPKKGYKTVSLGPLATFLGWDMGGGWHSADADSEASYEAFKRLVRRAADHENSGKPVRRDLFAPGGGEKEYAERMAGYTNEKRGWDWKVKKYKEAQPAETPGEEGFASRGSADAPVRRAKNPASWKDMTPEERDKATQESAQAAIDYINGLIDLGTDISALKDLSREELDEVLEWLVPGGEARVSNDVTGEGKALIEVSNATMGKVFMSLGFNVTVISDDPNEQYLLENGINDLQKSLKDYVVALSKDPDALRADSLFRDWAKREGKDIDSMSAKQIKKLAKDFASEFEIDLCLYYKAGTNMLCGSNIGIEREKMPQLGGRMKGDDTLAARAIRAGLLKAKEFKLDDEKLKSLDEATQKELRDLASDPEKVMELAKKKDPKVQQLWDVLNWNDSEASAESFQDTAAKALLGEDGIDDPRFVDPATMLGAQNQLQGSKVEDMADGATSTMLETILNLNGQAIPILDDSVMTDEWVMKKFGVEKEEVPNIRKKIAELREIAADPARYKEVAESNNKNLNENMSKIIDLRAAADIVKANPAIATPEKIDEYLDYLHKVRKHGLFQPTLTAGLPGTQIYMLDGHHRWSGLLVANNKLRDLGLDVRVKLNIKNYKTDIRTGLELGRAIQEHFGIKDAKVKGEDLFVPNLNLPELTQEEFDKAVNDFLKPENLKKAIKRVREGGQFRETEGFDVPGGQQGRLKPRRRPIGEVVDEVTGNTITLDSQSRVKGVKGKRRGYRAAGSGSGWQSVEDYIKLENERGNELFETYKEYVDKGYEAVWVTHTPGEAGRYVVSAGDVDAWQRGEVDVRPEDIQDVSLAGATLVGTDDEGGFLYVRKKRTPRAENTVRRLEAEEEMLDGFASTGIEPVVEKLPDGSVRTTYPNGRVRTVSADGRRVEDSYPVRDRKPGDKPASFGIWSSAPKEGEYDWLDEEPEFNIDGTRNIGRRESDGFASRGAYYPNTELTWSLGDVEEIMANGKADEVQKIIDDGWKASADDIKKAQQTIDEIEERIGKKKADALRKKLDRMEGARQKFLDAIDPVDYEPRRPYVLRDDTTGRGTGLPNGGGGFGIRTGDPEKDRKLQEELEARDKEIAELDEFLRRTSQSFDDWANGFTDDGKPIGGRVLVADNWHRRVSGQVGKPTKEWSNIDRDTGAAMPGNPIYREVIRMAPSGTRGRRTYRFEADEEGYVSAYDKKGRRIASLLLDRGFTREGGVRKQRDDRHHIEYDHVDEAHRRRGIATLMAEIAEHAYGGRIEHSQILSTTGKKWRDADVKRRGTPALPDPFEDEDGSLRVPVDQVAFASRGNYQPLELPGQNEEGMAEDSLLDRFANKLGLEKRDLPDTDAEMNAITARIGAKIVGGEATLAERLGITPEQLRDRLEEIAGEINQFVDRFVNDKELRQKIKLGYKLLSVGALLFGAKGMKDFLSTINPSFDGGGDGSSASSNSLLSIVDQLLSAGVHEALIAYGVNFANLIATEYAAMRLVTRQKAKEMIADIRARIEGTGQKIGVMSTEMWNRLRGAWAKTRAIAPIPAAAGVKEWIVAGSSPMWAEMSWGDYQTKSRITQKLRPTNQVAWASIAVKVGQSPELIDIAAYRSGIGYGRRRVKPRDVVRVYL